MEHTKEPWAIERKQNGAIIKAIGPLRADEYAGSAWLEVEEEDARRIVACVNACAGIPTDGLEKTRLGKDVLLEIYNLRKQRDELLAFAEEVRRSGDTRLASMAIAVLANVKGGT